MAKTSAQRQAAYRYRCDEGEGDRRLNTWISVPAYFALKRLALKENVTQREMIERLVIQTDALVLKKLNPDTPEWDKYFNVTQ